MRILLTGASGFLGTHIINAMQGQYQFFGLSLKLVNPNLSEHALIDISNTTQLLQYVQAVQPEIIIHTAAISSIAACAANEPYSHAINVTATEALSQFAAQYDIPFVFTSTDLIYDGVKGNYNESDTPAPINVYGQQKYLAEQALVNNNSQALILRMPLMVGDNELSNVGVIADLRNTMLAHKTAYLFTDEYRTPIHVYDAVAAIFFLLQKKCTGIYNISGSQKFSRYELGNYIKKKYALQQLQIAPTTHALQKITNRPKDVSMNNEKLLSSGFIINTAL